MAAIEPVKLFIGMPVYNGEKYIYEAVNSIISQDFSGWSLLISDNCSTDDTARIAQELAEKDSRIEYVRQAENIGAMGNFQYLVEGADCKYFMWAAADDLWESNYLSDCVAALDADEDVQFAGGGVKNIDPEGNIVRIYKSFHAFSSRVLFLQLFKYLLAPEIDGKANLIYSIFRLNFCKSVCSIPNIFNGWGADMAFVAAAIARGQYSHVETTNLLKRVVTEEDITTAKCIENGEYSSIGYWGWFPPEKFHEYLTVILRGATTFSYKALIIIVMYLRLGVLRLKMGLKKLLFN